MTYHMALSGVRAEAASGWKKQFVNFKISIKIGSPILKKWRCTGDLDHELDK